jgi:hypothetical protein
MLVWVVAPAVARDGREGPAELEFEESPGALVVAFSDGPGELAEPDGSISVEIYGDGRVDVHYPSYMKRAGDYTLQLEPQELRALLRSLAARGLIEFDTDAVRRAKRRAREERRARRIAGGATGAPVLQSSSDGTVSRIELRLRRYRRSESDAVQKHVKKQIRWHGLRADARRHPEIRSLGELEAARQTLRGLGQRPDLERRR